MESETFVGSACITDWMAIAYLARGPSAVKTQTTGYWTFFCNPAKWQIDEFLATNRETDDYQITDWQEVWFKPGQLGIVRVGVDQRTKGQLGSKERLSPGIYGI